MKTLSILFTFILLLNSNCWAQNPRNGYYKTYEDFKNYISTEAGEMEYVGQTAGLTFGPYFVYFKGNQKKEKIRGNSNWGCRFGFDDYKFYKGKAYLILRNGKIMTFRIEQRKLNYCTKGDQEKVIKLFPVTESLGYELFGDDPQVLQEFQMKLQRGGIKNPHWNILLLNTCIEKYNVRNK